MSDLRTLNCTTSNSFFHAKKRRVQSNNPKEQMVKILIIGGSRFFGRRLVHLLAKSDHEVTVFNRGSRPFLDPPANLTQWHGDRNDPARLAEVIRACHWDVIYDQICYHATQALSLAEICRSCTQRVIFTSTQAVYPTPKVALREDEFDPFVYRFQRIALSVQNYGEAKRQCEAILHQKLPNLAVSVRFPVVVGMDDYTQRLAWHVGAVYRRAPVYHPNLGAQISLLHAQDAAQALCFLANRPELGAFNVSPPDAMTIQQLIDRIASVVGVPPTFSASVSNAQQSVLNWKNSCTMDARRIQQLGFSVTPMQTWLDALVRDILATYCP